MVPADGNFTAAIAKGNHKQGVVQGQTRQHARLINLLGVKQLIVGINKMDCSTAKYSKERYDEIRNEMESMLVKVGWLKGFVKNRVPFMPISGWMGDNLLKKSDNMKWWEGVFIKTPTGAKKPTGEPVLERKNFTTLLQCLEEMVKPPERTTDVPLRMPVSGVYKIKGVGDVITGRLEQGKTVPGDEVIFVPTNTSALACNGKVFTVEMHHTNQPEANAGDNVGLNVKGLPKENMPRVGDVMIKKTDTSLKNCLEFTAELQVLDHPGELKKGYCPIAFVRTARSAVKIMEIVWKQGKETGGQRAPDAAFVKANDFACIKFEPQQPFVCENFNNCEGLGRVAILEGNTVVMLGKITDVKQGEAKKK